MGRKTIRTAMLSSTVNILSECHVPILVDVDEYDRWRRFSFIGMFEGLPDALFKRRLDSSEELSSIISDGQPYDSEDDEPDWLPPEWPTRTHYSH
jgi:hypothetical protein